MQLGIGETLRLGREIEDKEQRITFLRNKFTPSLGKMIEYALEPEHVWDLPPGVPPYKENKYPDQESNLYQEVRRMYIFMKGTGDHVPASRKEINFVQLLENVAPDDVQLLLYSKEKALPFGYTAEEIREIFPGLISETTTEHQPDLTKVEPVVGAADKEEVVVDAPIPFTDEQLAEIAELSGSPIIMAQPLKDNVEATEDILPPPAPTAKQLAIQKARATREANIAARRAAKESGEVQDSDKQSNKTVVKNKKV